MLSYGYWKSRFGGDRDILGKKIVVNGYPLTVIGVSQAGFDGVEPGLRRRSAFPITMTSYLPRTDFDRLNDRRFRWAEVFGRLKPGITIEKAQAGLQPLFHQILKWRCSRRLSPKRRPS